MLGKECCSNPPTLNPNAGAGHVQKLAGLDAYVSGSSDSNLAVILASDIMGYEAPILSSAFLSVYLSQCQKQIGRLTVMLHAFYDMLVHKKIADKLANAGYYAVVPDFFYGDPWDPDNPDRPVSIWEKDHEPDKGAEDAKRIIEALKGKGVSSVGAAGFCWGGKVGVDLAKPGLTKAVVLLHPADVTVDDIKEDLFLREHVRSTVLLKPQRRRGHVEKVGGLDSYVSGAPDSKLAVLLISGISGYESPLLRKVADKLANAGYYAVVPDFFYGDPWNPENPDRPIPIWKKDHQPDKTVEDAKHIIESVKGKGVSSVGAAGSVGVLYLIPKKFIIEFADMYIPVLTDADILSPSGKIAVALAKPGLTKAVVLLHAGDVTVDSIKGPSSVPTHSLNASAALSNVLKFQLLYLQESWILFVLLNVLNNTNMPLAAKPEVDSFVKLFPGAAHGWTVRYNEDDPEAVKAAEEAHQDMLNWFDNCSEHQWRSGHVDKIDGLDTYVTGPVNSKLAVLVISDMMGKIVVALSKPGLTKAGVLLHAGDVTVDSIKACAVVLLCTMDMDMLNHMWQSCTRLTVRYNEDDPEAVKAAEEAHQDMLNWFDKYPQMRNLDLCKYVHVINMALL
ncbi:endo-1,3-1,4-beta-D-glucanase [Senna tora]|uniref:Endo-1,3-1,4-beta-D-glucanase n=1 Tax=Senna tora TaxID=362788 RepID=A0A834T1V0_9FABA|nr:endo-1,3-1,4-beta-D-glucanase [Senna tora]